MDTAISFNDMLDPPVLLTAAQAEEIQNSPGAAALRLFALLMLTHTPDQIVNNLMSVEASTAREGLADGMSMMNACIECAQAQLDLAKLARARLLIASGAYAERAQFDLSGDVSSTEATAQVN